MDYKKLNLLLLSFVATVLYAQTVEHDIKVPDGITLISGELAPMFTQGESSIEFDFSETTFEKENIFEDNKKITDSKVLTDKVKARALSDFCLQFNYQNKGGLQFQEVASGVCPYHTIVHVSRLNEGNFGGKIFDRENATSGGASIDGVIEVREESTGSTLCKFAFCHIVSDSNLSKKSRITGTFEELGFQFGKWIKGKR